MNGSSLHNGSRIAVVVRSSSIEGDIKAQPPTTLGELLDRLEKQDLRNMSMLRTTSSLLSIYTGKDPHYLPLGSISETRPGFREFLVKGKYAPNSVRSYGNYVRILIQTAKQLGWRPDDSLTEEWRNVLALASEKKCADLARYLAGHRKSPRDVRIEDVDEWVDFQVQQGRFWGSAQGKRLRFWRLLRDCGCTVQNPNCLIRENKYGVPLKDLPHELTREVTALLKWKQAAFIADRPKGGKLRAVSSKRLEATICALFGFCRLSLNEEFTTLAQLVQKRTVNAYVEWCMNERNVKGLSLQLTLGTLLAAMHQHPSYSSLDLKWFRQLLDNIPLEDLSARKKRKAEKYLDYDTLESVPRKISAERPMASKRGVKHVARLVSLELLIKWLTVLPWRQRNLRECRIAGPRPNLFKAKIPPFSDIDLPAWVQEKLERNPNAEFWQFHFSPDETKTNKDVQALVPHQLVGLLEEYLVEFRPHLVGTTDPGTVFLNNRGNPMRANQVDRVVSGLTLRHGGRRVNPHLFRDIVAFTWLKAHPKDYLTLSKMLWHSNVNTTIQIYGSRFNESSGVCAMESWLDEREIATKPGKAVDNAN